MDWTNIATRTSNALMICVLLATGFSIGNRMGYLEGQRDGDCHCAAGCACEAAPDIVVSDDINRLSDWFKRLDERLQRIERRRDVGEDQPEPAGQMQEA